MLLLRVHMYGIPVIRLVDSPISEGLNESIRGLPASGFQPGHLLRDTLKNDEQQGAPFTDIGRFAYRQFSSSPVVLRSEVVSNLDGLIATLPDWFTWLNHAEVDFLCVGESHQDNYRRFLARSFFREYPVDVLFLEAKGLPTTMMKLRSAVGEKEIDLLNADIAEVIRATKASNPDSRIIGIEESSRQESERLNYGSGGRDGSIYVNIVQHYQPGATHAALLGALHCNDHWDWLYTRLERSGSALEHANLLNIRVMSRNKDLLSREFSRFLKLVGYSHDNYVITKTDMLHPKLHEWFLDLSDNFTKYEAVVVFDSGARSS